jgi:hypothetical protein
VRGRVALPASCMDDAGGRRGQEGQDVLRVLHQRRLASDDGDQHLGRALLGLGLVRVPRLHWT